MRALSRLAVVSGFALALAAASAARGEYVKFDFTHAIRFSHNGVIREVVSKTGTGTGFGYALVNRAGSSTQLNTLEFVAGPFATITEVRTGSAPGSVNTPPTPVFFNEVPEIRFEGVRIDLQRAGLKGFPGVFKPIHGAAASTMGMLSFNTLPVEGTARLCFAVLQPCATGGTVAVNLSQNDTTTMGMTYAIGPGVGGAFTAMGMSGTKVSVMGNPWTIKTAMASYTMQGGPGVLTGMGFAKGPGTMGMLGTTLANGFVGGMVQFVTPVQATCSGFGSCESFNSPAGQIARLTLTFQPEPGSFVSLCAGAVLLALLGRRRVGR